MWTVLLQYRSVANGCTGIFGLDWPLESSSVLLFLLLLSQSNMAIEQHAYLTTWLNTRLNILSYVLWFICRKPIAWVYFTIHVCQIIYLLGRQLCNTQNNALWAGFIIMMKNLGKVIHVRSTQLWSCWHCESLSCSVEMVMGQIRQWRTLQLRMRTHVFVLVCPLSLL